MLRGKASYTVVMAALAVFTLAGWAMAQDTGPGPGPGNNGGRGRGRMTAEERQKAMEDMQKQRSKAAQEQMGATDDEWKVLEPKIAKVRELAQQSRVGMMGGMGMGGRGPGGMMGGRGGRGGRGATQPAATQPAADAKPPTTIEKSFADLQTVLKNKDAKKEDITKALADYRAARDKARAAYAAAQKDLKEVLTLRQEAVLVSQQLID